MKDFLAETCFEKGWQSIDRQFGRLKKAADKMNGPVFAKRVSNNDISNALDKLSSQVEIFADNWQHFHLRIDALLREYGLTDLLEEYEREEGF
ncbi:hypothetical protein GF402_03060 [Candidatus Fermentibacteria bacterium]|nr:hypothetical protein [Candidatus Fermentibacteria bacterium]